jgi:PadR family transcriptional regulator PadR
MSKREYLGTFESIVLGAVLRLRENAYGMTVRREIEERTGRSVSIGAVYATLERLEGKGFVTCEEGTGTPERGGRARRFFVVTALGVRAANDTHEAVSAMWRGMRPAGVLA